MREWANKIEVATQTLIMAIQSLETGVLNHMEKNTTAKTPEATTKAACMKIYLAFYLLKPKNIC